MSMYSYCMLMYLHPASWHFGYTDWGFSVIFLICNANASVYHAKMGHGPNSSIIFVSFFVLFCVVLCIVVCKCVLYYCHWMATQLQLNIYQASSFLQHLFNCSYERMVVWWLCFIRLMWLCLIKHCHHTFGWIPDAGRNRPKHVVTIVLY